jgi:hypothetical protein
LVDSTKFRELKKGQVMDNRALKKINGLRYALEGARVLVGFVLIVPYLSSIAVASLGFLGSDPELVLYGISGYAITALLSAGLEFVHDQASRSFEASRLRHYEGKTWHLPNGRLGHFSEVSYTGAEIRLCDEDGRNEWHSVRALNRIQPKAKRRSDDELKHNVEQGRKKIVGLGIKAACTLATMFLVAGAHDLILSFTSESASATMIAGYLAHAGWLFAALIFFIGVLAVREFLVLRDALEEYYAGKNWTTPESSVGLCVAVWPYPETLTLKFSNGLTRDYERGQLAVAA